MSGCVRPRSLMALSIGSTFCAMLTMDSISQFITFQPGSIKPPANYLGANISQCTLMDGNNVFPSKQVWAMSAQEYIKCAVDEAECELKLKDSYLPKKIETPFLHGYRPELDFSTELDPQKINYNQGLIGVLRRIVELGRIDIIVPVTMLSRYPVSPREGHLQQAYRIFAYLKQFNPPMLIFDDSEPIFPKNNFHMCDWNSHYPDASEKILVDAPEPLGHSVSTTCYVDADHAGCHATRQSHTGVLVYVNCAPVVWSLRYKLRMFGIPVDDATIVFCDNQAVVINSTHSESTLKK